MSASCSDGGRACQAWVALAIDGAVSVTWCGTAGTGAGASGRRAPGRGSAGTRTSQRRGHEAAVGGWQRRGAGRKAAGTRPLSPHLSQPQRSAFDTQHAQLLRGLFRLDFHVAMARSCAVAQVQEPGPPETVLRLLVPVKRVGAVIGKHGSVIKEVSGSVTL